MVHAVFIASSVVARRASGLAEIGIASSMPLAPFLVVEPLHVCWVRDFAWLLVVTGSFLCSVVDHYKVVVSFVLSWLSATSLGGIEDNLLLGSTRPEYRQPLHGDMSSLLKELKRIEQTWSLCRCWLWRFGAGDYGCWDVVAQVLWAVILPAQAPWGWVPILLKECLTNSRMTWYL